MQPQPPIAELDWPELLEAARNGNGEAFGILSERLRDYLLLTAGQGIGVAVRSKISASDVVQATFFEAHRDLHCFNGKSEADFRVWLTTIVKHNLIDVARQYRQTQSRDTSREWSLDAGKKPMAIASRQKSPSSLIRHRERDEGLLQAVELLSPR